MCIRRTYSAGDGKEACTQTATTHKQLLYVVVCDSGRQLLQCTQTRCWWVSHADARRTHSCCHQQSTAKRLEAQERSPPRKARAKAKARTPQNTPGAINYLSCLCAQQRRYVLTIILFLLCAIRRDLHTQRIPASPVKIDGYSIQAPENTKVPPGALAARLSLSPL